MTIDAPVAADPRRRTLRVGGRGARCRRAAVDGAVYCAAALLPADRPGHAAGPALPQGDRDADVRHHHRPRGARRRRRDVLRRRRASPSSPAPRSGSRASPACSRSAPRPSPGSSRRWPTPARSRRSSPASRWPRRSGAGFTAQLGAMRISEEIDALEVMGVNSVVYLVATRVWAALITHDPAVPGRALRQLPRHRADRDEVLRPVDRHLPALLPAVPAADRHLLLVHQGDHLRRPGRRSSTATTATTATGGPAEVGVAVGRAIRLSIIMVVVVNLLLSLVLFGGINVTAKLVG